MFTKHPIRVGERVVGLRMEEEFWDCLRDIAADRDTTVAALLKEIVAQIQDKPDARRIVSEVRVYILEQAKQGRVPPNPRRNTRRRQIVRSTT